MENFGFCTVCLKFTLKAYTFPNRISLKNSCAAYLYYYRIYVFYFTVILYM